MFNERHNMFLVWEFCSSALWAKNDHNAPHLIKQAAGSFTAVWVFHIMSAQMVLLPATTIPLSSAAHFKVWLFYSNNSLKNCSLWQKRQLTWDGHLWESIMMFSKGCKKMIIGSLEQYGNFTFK